MQGKNISLSSDGEMKFINLPESLCFSMETVHKVLLPPTEKHPGGQHSVTRDLLLPAHLSPGQAAVCRSGVWTWGPPRACESRVYFASLISLSCFWLIAFLHKMHIQKFLGDLIDGSCTHRPGYAALRCLPESRTTNPALLVAASPSTHPGILVFCVPLRLLHFPPLCLLHLHVYRVPYTLPSAFTPALQPFFRGDMNMSVL